LLGTYSTTSAGLGEIIKKELAIKLKRDNKIIFFKIVLAYYFRQKSAVSVDFM
jgi:hypothetical protein